MSGVARETGLGRESLYKALSGERSPGFDTILKVFGLEGEPSLARLAVIVRGADTDAPDLAPEVTGLVALSWGLHHNYQDDHELLAQGMVMYDALYAWCARSSN
mgnify:CR=1 FL=1